MRFTDKKAEKIMGKTENVMVFEDTEKLSV